MALIAGAYTATWNSVALGQVDENGIRIQYRNLVEPVRGQNYGDTVQDGIYQGVDMFCQLTSLEYGSGAMAAFWPFGAEGVLGVVGRTLLSLAKPLVLTAVAGTPAASSPATITAGNAILAPGQNLELLFSTKLRKVPLMFHLLPYNSSGTSVCYTQT